jgi:hypothetical protein
VTPRQRVAQIVEAARVLHELSGGQSRVYVTGTDLQAAAEEFFGDAAESRTTTHAGINLRNTTPTDPNAPHLRFQSDPLDAVCS